MHKHVLFLALFLVSCDDVTELEYYCNNQVSCFVPEGEENIEQNIIFENDIDSYGDRLQYCSLGKTTCEDKQIKCEGVVYVQEEQCDGKDNDCNGIVDDPELFYAGIANTKCYFEEVGECKYSEQQCVNGELICVHHTSQNYGEEVCDRKDNDCDGQYDEDIPKEYVYTGPQETAGVGSCRIGYTECVDGETVIKGMVLPRTEICSNNEDDDCDGIVDESENGLAATDYALLIDFSGSMEGERLNSVKEAICYSPDNLLFANNRYAIIGVSISYANDSQYSLDLVIDFTDLGTACALLESYNYNSGLDENQIDAIYRIFDPLTPVSLSWSNNSRKIYIFSDEPAQTLGGVYTEDAILGLGSHCVENNYKLGLFLETEFYEYGWDIIPEQCIEFVEDLDMLSNTSYLQSYFLQWFGRQC